MQTINPAPKQLFCRPDEAVTKTQSGIILSENAAEKPKTAEVINIGRDVSNYHSGDRIVYKSYSTTEIKLNNEDFILVAEDDVLGTVLDVRA